MLHPESRFSFMAGNRGTTNAAADWVRDTTRVELKASGRHFVKRDKAWKCFFQSIKPDLFHNLWLAIYSQYGVHFFQSRSADMLRLSTNGICTKYIGHQLQVLGPCNESDPRKALLVIQDKLTLQGCELVAKVHWDKKT